MLRSGVLPVLPTAAQRAPAARLVHTPAALCHVPHARRTPRQFSRLPSPHAHVHRFLPAGHAEQAQALGRDAPTCFVSDPMKVRRAIDPASHRLPPPRLLSIVLRRRLATQRLAQPLGTHALFAPATTLPAPRESWHSSTQFPHMPSQLAPYPSACGFGRLGTLEPGPAAALYADYSSSPAAHVLPAPRCA